jgi:hypothetical protein
MDVFIIFKGFMETFQVAGFILEIQFLVQQFPEFVEEFVKIDVLSESPDSCNQGFEVVYQGQVDIDFVYDIGSRNFYRNFFSVKHRFVNLGYGCAGDGFSIKVIKQGQDFRHGNIPVLPGSGFHTTNGALETFE